MTRLYLIGPYPTRLLKVVIVTGPDSWLKVAVTCHAEIEDPITTRLIEMSGRGVIVDDAADGPVLLTAFFDPREWPRVSDELEAYLGSINRLHPDLPPSRSFLTKIDDQDWNEGWKKYFEPFSPAPGLVIRPPWREGSPQKGEIELIVHPGQAFGTGHHATTAMCLRLILDYGQMPETMLDVGCGSGILALAALKRGVAKATGIDIDPKAIESAVANARLNGLTGGAGWLVGGPECLRGGWPLIVANLTAADLMALGDHLARLAGPGAGLILSGILMDQGPSVEAAFAPRGFRTARRLDQDEWTALLMRGES